MESTPEVKGEAEARFEVIAPRREGFKGIGVVYYWPSDSATPCVRLDSEDDAPAGEDGVRRIGRKTYGRLLAAQDQGRIVLKADPGEQAKADTLAIGRLAADLERSRGELRDMTARAEASERAAAEVRSLLSGYQAAVTEAVARAESAVKAKDEMQAKLDAIVKAPTPKAKTEKSAV